MSVRSTKCRLPYRRRYLKRIDRLCRGHLYLAGYGKHLGERVGLNDLPYDPRWIVLYDQPHEVFPLWVEKVFAIP
jgi:hypothetical protein